ncbi:peptide ABC transporter permease [Lewinellaceae bacterium SD302]|nr:peptide ABC transporter permease [Lewinellaceae bacterium SD302]
MLIFLKVFTESIRQALQQLVGSKLRTFLSLLGISIGIFCIIGVLSAVSSLQQSLEGSLAKLGDDVLYIDKWPWKDNSNDWWDYFQRPYPDFDDYETIKNKVPAAAITSYWTVPGRRVVKYKKNSVEGGFLFVTTSEMDRIFNIELEKGRFWSSGEYNSGADKLLLGHTIVQELFGSVDPIGKRIKMQGRYYEVIGTLAAAGEDLINPLNFDEAIIVGYNNAARFINLKNRNQFGGTVAAKAQDGVSLRRLEDDIRGALRASRRLKPREDDNFSMNELSMMTDALGSFFSVLTIIGGVIGFFSILVGGVSVANIMFVSVKERTSLIGVKKALGAKRFIILLEFLIESVILCLIGGLLGLLLVFLLAMALTAVLPFPIHLGTGNIILGVGLSVIIGLFAGVIPAFLAARMDPVDAMRS